MKMFIDVRIKSFADSCDLILKILGELPKVVGNSGQPLRMRRVSTGRRQMRLHKSDFNWQEDLRKARLICAQEASKVRRLI